MTHTTDIEAPASAEELAGDSHTLSQRVHEVLHRYPALSPAIVLILAMIVFSLLSDRFLRPQNLSLIAQQVSSSGTLAVGQTLIILTAGIDLSIGAVMVLSSLVMTKLVQDNGCPAVLALLVGAAGGGGRAGALNGLLVTRIKLPPFIVTLGTLSIFTAITLLYAKGQTIQLAARRAAAVDRRQSLDRQLHHHQRRLLMVLLYVVVGFALRYTAWGKHLYAVGDDAEASAPGRHPDQSGAPVSVYIVAGLAFAVAAWILIGRVGGGDPNSGATPTSSPSPQW